MLDGESVAPRSVNDVSYDARHFSRLAQHLVTLESESCCSAHCK